jgi:ATP-dependent RNA helicase DDX19/DBP5
MNYKKPSKIQETALPLLLSNPPTNMIAQSQSGTGKTAAFVITVLSRLDYNNPDKPQAIILAPARELARQIEGVVHTLGQFVPGLTIQAAVPGSVERNAPVKAMVIVGTPGTVMDLIKRRQLNPAILRTICLDEADNMLDQQGLGQQCLKVKQWVSSSLPDISHSQDTRMLPNLNQVLLFSATFPEGVNSYAAQFCPDAVEIRLRHNELTVGGIKQMYMDCNGEQGKYDTLVQLYDMMTIGSSIIFVKVRKIL